MLFLNHTTTSVYIVNLYFVVNRDLISVTSKVDGWLMAHTRKGSKSYLLSIGKINFAPKLGKEFQFNPC